MSQRSEQMEHLLDHALDNNHSVWVIGDVHGHFDSMLSLIEDMNLESNDHVLILGDLVDRGPKSSQIIDYVLQNEHVHAIMGNHEQMMYDSSTTDDVYVRYVWRNKAWGGLATLRSYPEMVVKDEHLKFIRDLPIEVVLKRHRMVHAGYDMNSPIEDQNDEILLKSRTIFHVKTPPDAKRQILVGHTPVQKITQKTQVPTSSSGVWNSPIKLEDGRPCVVGLDGGIHRHRQEKPALLALNLRSGEILKQRRLEISIGDDS